MENAGNVRVRFAPSPSGYLHTGGARTALYNWLMARKAGGSFVLRVEDTDEQRSTNESIAAILSGLSWLGIDWDEGPELEGPGSKGQFGPYFQSQRRDLHTQVAEELVKSGKAFYCPATEEEMTAEDGKKKLFSPYRNISVEEQKQRKADGQALPIRLKCERGVSLAWDDMVRGGVQFASDDIGDFVIVKSSGQPLYNLAVVCDDHYMKISHVLRGEDHISNTPKQLLIYRSMGWDVPQFGHMPLIVGMDRARLSKRHGATSVDSYREEGYMQEALVNFLLLIGWSPSGHSEVANQEIFTRDEMIKHFEPNQIVKAAGAFNVEKLDHFNGLYIRSLSPEDFVAALNDGGFIPSSWEQYAGADYMARVLPLFQDKLVKLSEIEQNAWYFFADPQEGEAPVDPETGTTALGFYNPAGVDKFILNNADAPKVLGEIQSKFEALSDSDWDEEHLATIVDGFCEEHGLGKGKVMQPWRVALTGDKFSPGFYDLVVNLGRETTLRRAKPWVERLSQG